MRGGSSWTLRTASGHAASTSSHVLRRVTDNKEHSACTLQLPQVSQSLVNVIDRRQTGDKWLVYGGSDAKRAHVLCFVEAHFALSGWPSRCSSCSRSGICSACEAPLGRCLRVSTGCVPPFSGDLRGAEASPIMHFSPQNVHTLFRQKQHCIRGQTEACNDTK